MYTTSTANTGSRCLPEKKGSNQKDAVPFFHYLGIYKTLDPKAIARRCALPFDPEASVFALRFMGTDYTVAFPDFALHDPRGGVVQNPAEQILLLHYLCEGTYVEPQGKQRSYQEIPWGTVYYQNFKGRCITRLAYTFGKDLPGFRRIMEENPALHAEALAQGDAGYRFEFMTGLHISFLVWAGDEEFPPSAQILFDDNVAFAFTAEDIAYAGELIIKRLRGIQEKPSPAGGPA
ncbi:MAG: DUF3786 domain-containing protein [Treponema sp.]|jgi:hypothetical protein|nr:DUF3786 domain-containing protein [Treponema sp.]